MCQLEAASLIFSSVARCLTCRDTVCIAHLEAHNAAHKGHGHKVYFLSNQNLSQFAQSAADFDSQLHQPYFPLIAAARLPDEAPAGSSVLLASADEAAIFSPASATCTQHTRISSFTNPLSPSLKWREPVGYFGSSAAAANANLSWDEAYNCQMPLVDLPYTEQVSGVSGANTHWQAPPLFVGDRSVHGGFGFGSGVW